MRRSMGWMASFSAVMYLVLLAIMLLTVSGPVSSHEPHISLGARRLQQLHPHNANDGNGKGPQSPAPIESDYGVPSDGTGQTQAPTFVGWDSPATSLFCGQFCHIAAPKEWEDDGNDYNGQIQSVLSGQGPAPVEYQAIASSVDASTPVEQWLVVMLAVSGIAILTVWSIQKSHRRDVLDPQETRKLVADERTSSSEPTLAKGYGAAQGSEEVL